MRRTDGAAGHAATYKSALFCHECAHASPVDGDWDVHEELDRTVYACPDCGTTIESRPTFGGGPDATATQRSSLRVTVRTPITALCRALALLLAQYT